MDSNTRLKFVTTPNQNSPISDGLCVIAGIDCWEHAYFFEAVQRQGRIHRRLVPCGKLGGGGRTL
uniref:Fe-Mn family superoxide dismutase n=1 Tax=Clostridium sp. NkU-1 TaxID=1095009 RepID=UPI003261AE94